MSNRTLALGYHVEETTQSLAERRAPLRPHERDSPARSRCHARDPTSEVKSRTAGFPQGAWHYVSVGSFDAFLAVGHGRSHGIRVTSATGTANPPATGRHE